MIGSEVEPQRVPTTEGLYVPKNFKFIFLVMASREGYQLGEWQKLVFYAGKVELRRDICGTGVEAPGMVMQR